MHGLRSTCCLQTASGNGMRLSTDVGSQTLDVFISKTNALLEMVFHRRGGGGVKTCFLQPTCPHRKKRVAWENLWHSFVPWDNSPQRPIIIARLLQVAIIIIDRRFSWSVSENRTWGIDLHVCLTLHTRTKNKHRRLRRDDINLTIIKRPV